MGRPRIYADEEQRKAARREYTKKYYSENKARCIAAQLRHWKKKLEEAGYTVIEPETSEAEIQEITEGTERKEKGR